jgi:hypothetical protein
VNGIMAGSMIGVKVGLLQNGVEIVQKVKEVQGNVTGIQAGTVEANANIVVRQEAGTVGIGGVIIGGEFDIL